MKIYFDGIIYSWAKEGGVCRYFNELVKGCAQKKLDITIIMHEPNCNPEIDNKITVKKIGLNKKWMILKYDYVKKAVLIFSKILARRYFHTVSDGIFHSSYYSTYENMKIPKVLTVYDMIYERFPNFFNSAGAKRFIKNKKKCIDDANGIICISNYTKKILLETYQYIDENKVYVTHLGISENFKISDNSTGKEYLLKKYSLARPFVLFVGGRGFYKNFVFFIESFSLWEENQSYDIVLTGGGDLTKNEKKLIESLQLEKQINYIGFVSEEDLILLYNQTKFFIFPSLDEGFGMPLIEAIACGAQVLASDIPVFREIGENIPIYFNPQDKKDLTAAFNKMIKTPKDTTLASKNSKYVKDKFTWERCCKETINIYKRLKK